MRLEANPVGGFLRDCISFDPDLMMSTADFYAAFTGWREETHGDKKAAMDPRWIGRNLAALANPWIVQDNDAFKEEKANASTWASPSTRPAAPISTRCGPSGSAASATSSYRRMSEDWKQGQPAHSGQMVA